MSEGDDNDADDSPNGEANKNALTALPLSRTTTLLMAIDEDRDEDESGNEDRDSAYEEDGRSARTPRRVVKVAEDAPPERKTKQQPDDHPE